MKSFEYTITDPVGIHARPAGNLNKKAKSLAPASIKVTKDGKSALATKLMALMGLGVKQGETVTVTVEGENEDAAYEEIKKFFEENL